MNYQLFFKRNSATILTCAGGVGVVATAVLTAKATPKAMRLLEEAKEAKGEDLTNLEKIQAAGVAYIPPLLVGVSTIACIFGANALNKRQQASLTSAYALLDSSYKEYRKKVEDIYGEGADENVKNEIAKEKYKNEDVPADNGFELFYDEFSGRFFRSTLLKVQSAQYEINRDLTLREWATINDYYDYLDIPYVDGGDVIGWSAAQNEQSYWQTWVDFSNLKMVDDDGLEYYIVRMYQEPTLDFEDFE